MRIALTFVIVILCGAALIYLGGGSAIDIRRAIPFFGGYVPGWWDFAALFLIVFTIGRIVHMLRGRQASAEEGEAPEATEAEDSMDEEDEDADQDDVGADDGEEDDHED
jgi:hypothetical protein